MPIRNYSLLMIYFLLSFGISSGQNYIYPVAHANTPYGFRILLIYQNDNETALYTWDPESKIVRKGMPSHYMPTNIVILPDESGFSFVDNGILRIKKFAKRSAKTIEMLDPLYDFSTINWIDTTKAYLSAKRRDFYEIVEIDYEGIVEPVISIDGVHCLYPQKVGNTLLYIESSAINSDHKLLVSTTYPSINRISLTFNDDDHFDYRVQRIIQHEFGRADSSKGQIKKPSQEIVLDLYNTKVVNFEMINEIKGVVTSFVEQREGIALFACSGINRLKKGRAEKFFEFYLPIVLDETEALYDLPSPLLPVIDRLHGCIYFSSVVNDSLVLYSYSLKKQTINRISPADQSVFCFKALPTPCGVWYGGNVIVDKESDFKSMSDKMPYLWVNENQVVCLHLPEVNEVCV